ncbi:MAG TPA: hypothetical protein PLP17_16050 [Oligoflexia bacterium]|nr:hypothetical protein [Oligoflexia bacterium]
MSFTEYVSTLLFLLEAEWYPDGRNSPQTERKLLADRLMLPLMIIGQVPGIQRPDTFNAFRREVTEASCGFPVGLPRFALDAAMETITLTMHHPSQGDMQIGSRSIEELYTDGMLGPALTQMVLYAALQTTPRLSPGSSAYAREEYQRWFALGETLLRREKRLTKFRRPFLAKIAPVSAA